MEKEVIFNANHQTIFSVSPANSAEVFDWYTVCFNRSVKWYKDVICTILEKKVFYNTYIISFHPVYKKQNALEKKAGASGVFSKYGINYHCLVEKTINSVYYPYSQLVSVTTFTQENLDLFFISQIQSLICCVKDVNEFDLIQTASNCSFDQFVQHVSMGNNLVFKFHDVGCDGNSLFVYGRTNYCNASGDDSG